MKIQIKPTEKQIDQMIVDKIRKQYDVNEELKILRLGSLDNNNEDFIKYNNYVNDCILYGKTLKTKYGYI